MQCSNTSNDRTTRLVLKYVTTNKYINDQKTFKGTNKTKFKSQTFEIYYRKLAAVIGDTAIVIDHSDEVEIMPFTTFIVIMVMCWRDLDSSCKLATSVTSIVCVSHINDRQEIVCGQ